MKHQIFYIWSLESWIMHHRTSSVRQAKPALWRLIVVMLCLMPVGLVPVVWAFTVFGFSVIEGIALSFALTAVWIVFDNGWNRFMERSPFAEKWKQQAERELLEKQQAARQYVRMLCQERLEDAERSGKASNAQSERWKLLWLEQDPPWGEHEPPVKFNPLHSHHVAFAERAIQAYGQAVAERPLSWTLDDLPFPVADLERALKFILSTIDSRPYSPHSDLFAAGREARETVEAELEWIAGLRTKV